MILHKRYKFCPECQSVMIRRVHRGLIQKYIFRQKPKYRCGNCEAVFFTPLFEKDLKKLQVEENEMIFEKKPTLSLEEIHEISAEVEENKGEKRHEFEKDLQAIYEKGFEKGFAKGFKKGMQH